MDNAMISAASAKAGFAETFAGMILSPAATLSRLAAQSEDIDLARAAGAVALVFAVDGLRLTEGHKPIFALLNVPVAVLLGAVVWLSLAGLLALLAVCFKAPKTQIKAIFVTTGFAFAPWILMAPIWSYRFLLGHWLVLFALLPLFFVSINQILAVTKTFDLKVWQALALVIVVPLLWQVVSSMQALESFYLVVASLLS